MIKIDDKLAIQLLQQAVAERGPDYVYGEPGGDCFYTDLEADGTGYKVVPGCIVGMALYKAGFPMAELEDIQADVNDLADELSGKVQFTDEARVIFQNAQARQDRQEPWGQAVAETLDEYEAGYLKSEGPNDNYRNL